MALMSMTGFARRDGSVGAVRYAWELRSVNGRGLDLRFRLPPGMDGLEAKARAKAGAALSRGNVSLTLTLAREGAARKVRINRELLDLLIETAEAYRGRPGIGIPALDGLMAVPGVVESVEEVRSEEESRAQEAELMAAFEATLREFQAARAQEGRALSGILGRQIDDIEKLVADAEALPGRSIEAIKARISDQLALLIGRDDLNPERLHQEAALLATKADIREELDRLTAHIAQARELMAGGTAVGRRLDFLAQEFNRETNTLCSKSNDTALTRIGLALKAVVDQFKEQVQNVE